MYDSLKSRVTTKINPELLPGFGGIVLSNDENSREGELYFGYHTLRLGEYIFPYAIKKGFFDGLSLIILELSDSIKKFNNGERVDFLVHSVVYHSSSYGNNFDVGIERLLLDTLKKERVRVEGVEDDFQVENFSWDTFQTSYRCFVRNQLDEDQYSLFMNPQDKFVRRIVSSFFPQDLYEEFGGFDIQNILIDK